MAPSLPRFAVLKSVKNESYLHYINNGVEKKHLKFSGEEIVHPCAKFAIEKANNDPELVHIRSCYNNKYWVAKSENEKWILAAAEQPEEDRSKWSCTLFKPVFVEDDAIIIQFLHVKLGLYVQVDSGCLSAVSEHPLRSNAYKVIDWETLVILPKHVAFKSDNGKYLIVRPGDSDGHFRFMTFVGTDIGDEKAGHEIFSAADGNIHIKSKATGKYWTLAPYWIWPIADKIDSSNNDMLFWPVKIEDNVIALKNLGDNCFCKRHGDRDNFDCISAVANTISNDARLYVEELVLSRKIYDVKFRLDDSIIYTIDQVLVMARGDAINMNRDPYDQEIKLKYKETKDSSWDCSLSLKLNLDIHLKAAIPFIEKARVKITSEFEGKYNWSKSIHSETEIETTYKVKVPPMTKVTVYLVATKGSCEVPFSYTQQDVLTTGEQLTYYQDDGVYHGTNCFNFSFKVDEEKIEGAKEN